MRGHSITGRGTVASFDGREAHFVLPFAGHRVSFVAFTHQAVYSDAARTLVDQLIRCGLKPPHDAGMVRVFPMSRSRDEGLQDDAWKAYANSCEEAMHISTESKVRDAKKFVAGGTQIKAWGGIARLFSVCIFTAITQGSAMVEDKAWSLRLISGGHSRRRGSAYPLDTRCRGSARDTRMHIPMERWIRQQAWSTASLTSVPCRSPEDTQRLRSG